ncbi:hypothetical protein ASPWEDRAFT_642831 [Aspergillus wentii DTO 134E9]|uniref:Secreted protein n=1 Tax=Aspergillus wentii DTO 134E9 TaxID=1073089 RepID=A0A1L9RAL1_ASPWE|nr:uncharacterized protein ASPWEDRAFT_642831 [Aspergillus wentii DTO 134E9]OJJ31913.1 hypothetical protein ASPWEDRAFT_642831 [Aspergillus wentii DTO 134E9]
MRHRLNWIIFPLLNGSIFQSLADSSKGKAMQSLPLLGTGADPTSDSLAGPDCLVSPDRRASLTFHHQAERPSHLLKATTAAGIAGSR